MKNKLIKSVSKKDVIIGELRRMVTSKELQAGDRFPSENELSQSFGVSRMTVREAMTQLINDGLAERQHGKGTFVQEPRPKPKTIALVIPSISMEGSARYSYYLRYIGPLINYIEEEAKANGANVLLYLDQDKIETEREVLLRICQEKPDGAIVLYIGGEQNKDCLQQIQTAGIPLVLPDRWPGNIMCNKVASDHFTGAYDATKLLIEEGFYPVYHITNDEPFSSNAERRAGYEQALRYHGFDPEGMIRTVQYQYSPNWNMDEATAIAARAWIDEMGTTFGIFGLNSAVLRGTWQVIEEKGIDYRKIGFACFDEFPSTLPDEVFLVNILQPLEDIARKSVQLVLHGTEGSTENVRFPTIVNIHRPNNERCIAG